MNKDFYKKSGFIFLGIILVLIVARFTVLAPGVMPGRRTEMSGSKAVVDWQDAGRFVGEHVTVGGRIIRTYKADTACFLNFHSGREKRFYAVIFSSDFDKFSSNPEDYYRNKKVEVTGLVKEYQGVPQIILNSPAQIRVIK